MAPRKSTERTVEKLVNLVQGHYQPSPSVIVQRLKFYLRAQKQRESVTTSVSELRRLSELCKYGKTLERMRRDRIVCRNANNQLQRGLLAEPDKTFNKALEFAKAQESTDQGYQQMQQQQKH